MKKHKIKNRTIGLIACLLACTGLAVCYADYLLLKVYHRQLMHMTITAEATPVPVINTTPTPRPTPTPTPQPSRRPMPGDIPGVNFPEYDTGAGAEYSYQSNELRIAVDKIEEDGVTYFVADIWMRNINCFRTAFSSGKYRGKREDADKISRDNNAILGINGDFLNGLAIRNGVMYSPAKERVEPTPEVITDQSGQIILSDGPASARPERSTCVLYYDGRIVTKEFEDFRTKTAMAEGAWQGWQFGPTLIRDGKPAGDVNPQGRNPRSMLGYYEPGHYCLITIDGRQKGYSIGMNFKEMMELAQRLGLKEAYNLDGGASAIMTFDGQIINSPSGDDARTMLDMVVIGEYLDPAIIVVPPTPTPRPTPEG